MNSIELVPVPNNTKIGSFCLSKKPNVTEDTLFAMDGEVIGFYLTKMPEKMCKLAAIANNELRSNRVPKTSMNRKKPKGFDATKGIYIYDTVTQWSVLLGAIPPKPVMKRTYPTYSRVHAVATAQTFVKTMILLAKESEKLIGNLMPEQYEKQLELFKKVPDKWKFGNIFTSSISNYNISAPFHRDTGNIVGTVNAIICKRRNSTGGDLHIPDYDATIGQRDNSILVYPAWRNIHGVTPIVPTVEGGYRNSLVFYPLKAFVED